MACAPASRVPSADTPADWNPEQVAWQPYAAGLEAARTGKKGIVLIFYTDWCPHCHTYSRLFHDAELVELARGFVMIRVERDANPDLSDYYNVDGDYVPRTFFLDHDAQLWADLDSGRADFRYFLDEHDPRELVELMQEARDRGHTPGEARLTIDGGRSRLAP